MRTKCFIPLRGRHAFTLVEILIAMSISALVVLSAIGLTITTGRMGKSIFAQQRSLKDAKGGIERLNREIRLATTPLSVLDAAGQPAMQGNTVAFARAGEAAGLRRFFLQSDDADLNTPGDNRLIYDPNVNQDGDEQVVARTISPSDPLGAFSYEDATTPLVVQLRTGDSLDEDAREESDRVTGVGMQGMEINITVAPRN
jgi:prepilin-type N-terminal cleavage/methylation domain-containing protein